MKKINNDGKRIYGGRTYYCPWSDYRSSSYWKTYAHAIKCAYRRGVFNVPIWMIKLGLRLR